MASLNAMAWKAVATATSSEQQERLAALQKLCRICLAGSRQMVNIFDLSQFDRLKLSDLIIDVMESTCPLEVENSLLPQFICQRCEKDIYIAYSLRRKCEKNHRTIQQQLEMIQQMNIKDEPPDSSSEDELSQPIADPNESILPDSMQVELFEPLPENQNPDQNVLVHVKQEKPEEEMDLSEETFSDDELQVESIKIEEKCEIVLNELSESNTSTDEEDEKQICRPIKLESNTLINPRLLLIRKRSQLDTDKDLREEGRGVGPLQCGLCLVRCNKAPWKTHFGEHYGIGWLNGKSPPLLTKRVLLKQMDHYLAVNRSRSLRCRMCYRQFNSAWGTLKHLLNCGTQPLPPKPQFKKRSGLRIIEPTTTNPKPRSRRLQRAEPELNITKPVEIDEESSKMSLLFKVQLGEEVEKQWKELVLTTEYTLFKPKENLSDFSLWVRALRSIKSKTANVTSAAYDYNLPSSRLTLYLKMLDLHNKDITQEPDWKLLAIVRHMAIYASHSLVFTEEQEKALEDYLMKFGRLNYGCCIFDLNKLIFEFALKQNVTCPLYWNKNQSPGHNWAYGFLMRHKNVHSLFKNKPSAQENVNTFFDEYSHLMELHKFEPHQIFNMGMLHFSTSGKVDSVKNIASARWQTVAVAINAAGNSLPTCYLVDKLTETESMWNSLNHFLERTNSSPDNRTLLLLDNNLAHFSIKVFDWAAEHGISLLKFPPKCSVVMQPLELVADGPMTECYGKKIKDLQKAHQGVYLDTQLMNGLVCLVLEEVLISANIKPTFDLTGIFPPNALLALSRTSFMPTTTSD